jgi:hypothetical protein
MPSLQSTAPLTLAATQAPSPRACHPGARWAATLWSPPRRAPHQPASPSPPFPTPTPSPLPSGRANPRRMAPNPVHHAPKCPWPAPQPGLRTHPSPACGHRRLAVTAARARHDWRRGRHHPPLPTASQTIRRRTRLYPSWLLPSPVQRRHSKAAKPRPHCRPSHTFHRQPGYWAAWSRPEGAECAPRRRPTSASGAAAGPHPNTPGKKRISRSWSACIPTLPNTALQ